MTAPGPARLRAAMDATWPPAEIVERDGWRLRRGLGGGKRVSAAVALDAAADFSAADFSAAEATMADWGQAPLYQIGPDDEALDDRLSARRFQIVDRTHIFVANAATLLDDRSETARVVRGDGRVALMEEIWAAGGVGPARLAVMDRVACEKTFLLGRLGDRPAAVAFAAADGDVAMMHALETDPRRRRQGAARMLVASVARFAVESGAGTLALATTEANEPANALYRSLGMTVAARYHYRAAHA